uniref:Uncharacterized protein n=1 Tax=Ciona savignyi TaxID=51511 RepID=H2Z6D3_CIOSA
MSVNLSFNTNDEDFTSGCAQELCASRPTALNKQVSSEVFGPVEIFKTPIRNNFRGRRCSDGTISSSDLRRTVTTLSALSSHVHQNGTRSNLNSPQGNFSTRAIHNKFLQSKTNLASKDYTTSPVKVLVKAPTQEALGKIESPLADKSNQELSSPKTVYRIKSDSNNHGDVFRVRSSGVTSSQVHRVPSAPTTLNTCPIFTDEKSKSLPRNCSPKRFPSQSKSRHQSATSESPGTGVQTHNRVPSRSNIKPTQRSQLDSVTETLSQKNDTSIGIRRSKSLLAKSPVLRRSPTLSHKSRSSYK